MASGRLSLIRTHRLFASLLLRYLSRADLMLLLLPLPLLGPTAAYKLALPCSITASHVHFREVNQIARNFPPGGFCCDNGRKREVKLGLQHYPRRYQRITMGSDLCFICAGYYQASHSPDKGSRFMRPTAEVGSTIPACPFYWSFNKRCPLALPFLFRRAR